MKIDRMACWRLFSATGNVIFYLLYKELRNGA
ncbi:MAG: YqzL family protein [Oscillospiraceae bacterium]|nr:YqzL family protein [Oscillospiraceae bacterium]